MLLTYNGTNGNDWRLPENQDIEVLLKWHLNDLPDSYEISRQEYIYSLQGNRNPFVDHPGHACQIDFKNLLKKSTCSLTNDDINDIEGSFVLNTDKESLISTIFLESLSIFSIQGEQLIVKNNIQPEEALNIKELRNGIYIVLIQKGGEYYTRKIFRLNY